MSTQAVGALGATRRSYPGAAIAYGGVAIFFLTQLVSFLDRQILSLLIGPMKADLAMSDTEVGLLSGVAFAIFFAIAGFPIGVLVDRHDRPRILACGIAMWSVVTAACGFAGSFFTLFACRIGVGVGEATVTPVIYSMVPDYFPPQRRGLAFGLYATGTYVGAGLATVVGSIVIRSLAQHGPFVLPVVGELRSWQAVFLVVGLCGFLLLPLVLMLREPRRGRVPVAATRPVIEAEARVAAHFRRHLPAILTYFVGFSLFAGVLYGLGAWLPEFLRRTYHMPIQQAGMNYGIAVIFGGLIGVVLGGVSCDLLLRRGFVTAPLLVTLFAAVVCIPIDIVEATTPDPWIAVLMIFVGTLFGSMITGATPIALTSLFPAPMRGVATAVGLLFQMVISLSGGPLLYGFLTDHVFHDPQKLYLSMAWGSPAVLILVAVILIAGMGAYRRSVREIAPGLERVAASTALAT